MWPPFRCRPGRRNQQRFSKVAMHQPSSVGWGQPLPTNQATGLLSPAGAKLVVVARFQSCAQDAPQFVAAHFVVYGSAEGSMIEPVKLMAGDGSEVTGSASAPRQGVVLSGEIQNQKIRLASADSVEGSVAGLVTKARIRRLAAPCYASTSGCRWNRAEWIAILSPSPQRERD